ncbi:MAG: tetratricopeptide repeat protein [Henriciella sp.]|nr:tetratricopeptide repeat protein [Henriciella sp.]
MIDLSSPTPLTSALSSLALIGVLALIYGLFSALTRDKDAESGGGVFEHIISGARRLDRTLIRGFSWITGTRFRKKYVRIPVLLLYFLGLVAASVFLPWPYGMAFVGFGVFSIFVVFRHWSRDEDEAIAGIPFERKDIKIDGTLGAEVLVAVAFLFVFTPVAFAQLQEEGVGFSLGQEAGPFTFLIYTLIETIKAGSLIDYYDLYADRIGFEKIGAPVDPSNWAKATIMGYRLSLNLLVLAALKRLLDIAKRRAEGADLRAVAEALRQSNADKQSEAVAKLRDFALRGRGNARDLLETIAEPRQSEHLPIAPETRFAASDALLDYGTQRGGASALYAAADGYRSLMRDGFDQETEPTKWRAAAHNLGNTLVQLGQQIGDPERLQEASEVYEALLSNDVNDVSSASRLNSMTVVANVLADLAMMTGERADLERSVEEYKRALQVAEPEQHKAQIATLNTNLGATLADLAEIYGDETLIRDAIEAYRSALSTLSADDDKETWSMAQNNLGNALADLGFWTSDVAHLEASLKAHEQALTARQKADAPLLWAMSQTNLANALTRLAKLQDNPEHLRSAIEHYQAAQSVYQREDFPRDWSWAEASLAAAHIDLGTLTGDAAAFVTAMEYCNGAIGGYASARMPAKEAWAQSLKGNALVGLERFDDAAAAFEAALIWQTYENAGDDWVMSTNNLAACLHKLDRKEDALGILNSALEVAPSESKIAATLQALSETLAPSGHVDELEGSDKNANGDGSKIVKMKFDDWQSLNWTEGRFVNAVTSSWKLDIDGEQFHWRVTEQEYLEEDGQGKGAGHEVVDLLNDNEVLYRTFWDHWMNDNYDPDQDSSVDGDNWRIGARAGTNVFWAIYHYLYDQGIELFSRWDSEEGHTRERILALGTASLEVKGSESEECGEGEQPVSGEDTPAPQSISGTRHFHVSVQRVCGEFVIGHVSPAFFEYWKDRDDFESHVLNLGDPDEFDKDSPLPHLDGRDCEGWYAIDDIAHMNNAVFDGNVIQVDEMVPNEDESLDYAPLPGGYSEQFYIDDLVPQMPAGFFEVTKDFEVDRDVEAPTAPVFVGKSIEKGAQTDVYVSTEGAFDVSKLSFEIWNMDGDTVIASIRYDGVELEIIPDSSMGKAFYAYLGSLS